MQQLHDHPWCGFHSGSSRINTAVLNFPKLPCWPFGGSRKLPGVPGPTRIDTELQGGYTVYMSDHSGYDPC
ncbi:hypothetical protein DPMN_187404 [Dreissena polymorpha]|uniref:Uncharacterized protein n=1 Tax=Dreissena polymorpha TaxID=45954 RepID=A0A9D4DPN7_DREPO|nr:hypothetical protein DPMN_187404 [Dreissena polymorpha]